MRRILFWIFYGFAISPSILFSLPAPPFPYILHQPNGFEFTVRVFGDENENWIATMDGYIIMDVLDEAYDLWWYYALMNEYGELIPSDSLVGISHPPEQPMLLDQMRRVTLQRRADTFVPVPRYDHRLKKSLTVPPLSTLKPIVFMVDFPGPLPGQMSSHVYTQQHFTELFFAKNLNPNSVQPPFPSTYTMSMHDYFQEVSRKQLAVEGDINSVVNWTTTQNSYSYYVDGSQGTGRGPNGISRSAQAVCVEIAQAVDGTVDFSRFDADNDGVVDVVILVMEGWESNAQNQFYPFQQAIPALPIHQPRMQKVIHMIVMSMVWLKRPIAPAWPSLESPSLVTIF